MRHTTKVAKVGEVTTRKADDGDYLIFEVEITSAGRVTQVLQVPHHLASLLNSSLTDQIALVPIESRRASFQESIRKRSV
ncbi:hypothetical protein [Streptomyces globisporus]|uniref:hypothetical protein n=1 Tax=Streptomyces globisporus TaxID=1908 RepID=UPI0038217F11